MEVKVVKARCEAGSRNCVSGGLGGGVVGRGPGDTIGGSSPIARARRNMCRR